MSYWALPRSLVMMSAASGFQNFADSPLYIAAKILASNEILHCLETDNIYIQELFF